MRDYTFLYFILFCFVSIGGMHAQRGIEKKAEKYFNDKDYAEAIDYYSQLKNINKNNKALLHRAICYYHLNDYRSAERDFIYLKKKDKEESQVNYFLGKICHSKLEFEEAVLYYKNHLRNTKQNDFMRPMVRGLIAQCGAGIQVAYQDPFGFVESFGNTINTSANEIGVIQSPVYSNLFYFSSDVDKNPRSANESEEKRNTFAIYKVARGKIDWLKVELFDGITKNDESHILVDFQNNGKDILYAKWKQLEKYIYFNKNIATANSSKYLESIIIGEQGDRHIQFFNNNTILFSSKRAGGYGGYDIYISTFDNGAWTTPKNLGSSINTSSDELNPFLTKNGQRLYFSSNSSKSIGGLDIFYSDFYVSKKLWSPPYNLGIPINSVEDDTHFRVLRDGYTATFSSNRIDGFGKMDLYFAYLKMPDNNKVSSKEDLSYIEVKEKEILDIDNPLVLENNSPQEPIGISIKNQKILDNSPTSESAKIKESVAGEEIVVIDPTPEEAITINEEIVIDYTHPAESEIKLKSLEETLEAIPEIIEEFAVEPVDVEIVVVNDSVAKSEVNTSNTEEVVQNIPLLEEFVEPVGVESIDEVVLVDKKQSIELTDEIKNEITGTTEAIVTDQLNNQKPSSKIKENGAEKALHDEKGTSVEENIVEIKKEKEIVLIETKKEVLDVPLEMEEETNQLIHSTKAASFKVRPLFYKENRILSEQNTEKLDELAKLMKYYPDALVQLSCNTNEEGSTPYELFFTMERAEYASYYLVSKGINKNRVSIKALGNNYPLVKTIEETSTTEDLNRRLDIIIQNIDCITIPIIIDKPKIQNQSDKYTQYQERIKGLSYKVQIKKTIKIYQNKVLVFYNDPIIEKDVLTGEYLYSVGLEKDYSNAIDLKRSLINGGFESALIIPYFNGKRINPDKISEYSNIYPELKVLLSTNK